MKAGALLWELKVSSMFHVREFRREVGCVDGLAYIPR